LKYIDPTYMVRAVAANAADNLYCTLLAHSAIHGAVAGYTGFVLGPINGQWQQWLHAYIPVVEVAEARNHVDTKDYKWAWVRSVSPSRTSPTSSRARRCRPLLAFTRLCDFQSMQHL
jgi:6-phosphofructokinase 1